MRTQRIIAYPPPSNRDQSFAADCEMASQEHVMSAHQAGVPDRYWPSQIIKTGDDGSPTGM